MASGIVKPNRMKLESKKSHSSWWDSHISSRNSKWLQENLEEMDQNVKKMLKLIEEDADSFAKKAELYFKKRPELVSHVEEFHRMYRSLAERYGHVTGELKKNIPSDLQSQGSGISDASSEPSWTAPTRTKSGPRAAGFDFFLGSGGSCSDLNSKEGDDTSTTLDSDSESDDSSVNNYSSTRSNGGSEEHGLRARVVELEGELRDAKEKLQRQHQEMSEGLKKSTFVNSEVDSKVAVYEEELTAAREKIRISEDEISRLLNELHKCKSLGDSGNENSPSESSVGTNPVGDLQNEVVKLQKELATKGSSVQNLQDQLKLAQKEVTSWKNKCEREKRELSKMQDRIARYKANLADRDQEIRGLREAMSNANKALSEENVQLQLDMMQMVKAKAYLEDHIKELDLRLQSLEEEMRRTKAAKEEMEGRVEQLVVDVANRDYSINDLNQRLDNLKLECEALATKIDVLGVEMCSKDNRIAQMNKNLDELQISYEGAQRAADELGLKIKELEVDLERKEGEILEAWEGKREAIRQLVLSLEYYRSEYHQLRLAIIAAHKPSSSPVMAR